MENLHGPDWAHAWVVSFPWQDNQDGNTPNWTGTRAGRGLPAMLTAGTLDKSCYMSVAMLDPNASNRLKNHFWKSRLVVLDDVGTRVDPVKVRAALGEPAMILETSPGNYQWFYILSFEETDRLRYENVMDLLRDRKLTDGGGNAVRYVRLPLGVNGKTKCGDTLAKQHRVVLVGTPDFTRRLDKTVYDQLARDAALVRKDRAQVPSSKVGTYAADLSKPDDILVMLSDLGWIVGQNNREPKLVDIDCPFIAEHTTGVAGVGSSTSYLGGGRFVCLHAHCAHRNGHNDIFVEAIEAKWDEEVNPFQGVVTPKEHFARSRFTGKGVPVLDKNEIDVLVPDTDTLSIMDETNFENVLDKVVYVNEVQRFVVKRSGKFLNHDQFNAACSWAVDYGTKGKTSATALFMSNKTGRAVRLEALTYQPGKDRVVDGRLWNTWKGSGLVLPRKGSVKSSDVSRWLDHVAYIYDGDLDMIEGILDWCSFVLQNPGVKINYCPVLVGKQGIGKDLMLAPLIAALGLDNVGIVGPHELGSDYNSGWVQRQLILFNELAVFEKATMIEKLKPIIAAPPNEITVSEKFMPRWTIPNIAVTFAMTNHRDALALEGTDRRFWPYISEAVPKGAAYYQALADWYEGGGLALVARWLTDRAVSAGFSRTQCPADVTGAKAEMVLAGATDATGFVMAELIEGSFADVEVLRVRDLTGLSTRSTTPRGVANKINDKSVSMALEKLGWTRHKLARVPGTNEHVRLWSRKDISTAEAVKIFGNNSE
jgi:hypothetical protein